MSIVIVKCGWCREDFEVDNRRITSEKNKQQSFGMKKCPHCGRTVQASRKEFTGNIVGRKRWKYPLANGDIV